MCGTAGGVQHTALHGTERPGIDDFLAGDHPGGNALEVGERRVVELFEFVPSHMRAQERGLGDPPLAQAVEHHVVVRARRDRERVRPLEVFEVGVVRADDVVHMPQLRAHVLHHLDAVARVERPAVEAAHGVAFAVFVLELVVELESAQRHHHAFARFDGFRCFVVADERVAADYLLRVGVLDELLVVAVENDFDAEVGTCLVKRMPACVAALGGITERANVHRLGAFDPGIFAAGGAARGVRALLELRVDVPVIAVIHVLVALFRPRSRDVFRRVALREAGDVLHGSVDVVDPGVLAHVDGRVPASARGSFLKHEHVGLALVLRGDGGPQARAAVADDQHVRLVIPG